MKKRNLCFLAAATLFTTTNIFAAINQDKFDYYHQPGFAAQISTSSIDFARYTAKHQFTYGVGFSPFTYIKDSSESSSFSYNFFVRRNFPILNQLVAGIGASIGSTVGEEDNAAIKNALSAGPYVALEYAATPHVLLSASALPIFYSTKEVAGVTTTTWKAFAASSLQLSYLFGS